MNKAATGAALALLCLAGSAGAFLAPSTSGHMVQPKSHLQALPTQMDVLLGPFADSLKSSANVLASYATTLASEATNELHIPLSLKALEHPQALFASLTFSLPTMEMLMKDPNLAQFTALVAVPWHMTVITLLAVGNALVWFINTPTDYSDAPFEPGTNTYSPTASQEFYAKRPLMVLQRVLRLALLTGAFNTALLFDWLVLGKLFQDEEYQALRKAEPQRAKEALRLCEQLGPTFIKLGQALSIRTDLIPEPYALELRKLQDAVSPFDSKEAYDILRKEYGVSDLSQIFFKLSDKPVASASIGQVYRGTLTSNGKDVAVKVQRPGILAEIALDLYTLRLLTPIQTILQNAANGVQTTQEDIDTAVSLVDEWGRGFVAETDYRLEAENTRMFEAAMRKRGLDAVCAPNVVSELTRDKVLVTEWVTGTRLDRDASPDVPRLCGVAINAYLTMLLDTGVLHCDPHVGNLLRTTDGRLCILDWGMTLEVPKDLQYALLEFIAHINVEDYDSIPQDFINLGFSPPDVTAERLKSSGITEGLAFAFRQLSAGGGPKKIQERVKQEFQERYGAELSDDELRLAARSEMIERMEVQLASEGVDVKGVTNVMEEMSRRNRELFTLPPYVLYVARAFSTLEGIGLSIDENYAIVQECYPYLSRRLFTDRSPRAKKALKAMLGVSDEVDDGEKESSSRQSSLDFVRAEAALGTTSKPRTGLSPAKLIQMSDGFASYTAATADADRDGKGQAAAAAEFAKLFLDSEGSTLQDILVDETAKLGDAATRAALRAALVDNPAAQTAARILRAPRDWMENSEQSSRPFPGLIKNVLTGPADLQAAVELLLASTPEDERVLDTARALRDTIGARVSASNGNADKDGSKSTYGSLSTNVRSALASRLSDGAAGLFPPTGPNKSVPTVLSSIVSDQEQFRTAVGEQLPGVAALSRRIGAGLLRRAAYRTEKSVVLPATTRKVLIAANRALADAIDPKETPTEAKK